jgi:hypothetical protein
MKVAPVLFLCLLGHCAVSHTLPAVPSTQLTGERARGAHPLSPRLENARKMWNGAKKIMRRLSRRTRRDVVDNVDNVELEALTTPGEKFIIDLYWNLTTSTGERTTQANTVRSLDYNRNIGKLCTF